MCELLMMSSSVPATVNVELGVLARHGGGEGPDRDGWGIAYYQDDDVRLIKDAAQAYGSPWIGFVEGLALKSRLVIAHIRRATTGKIALRNTHPFARELHGRMHVFAHNGAVPSIFAASEFQLGRFRPVGETDSEFAFCALMERLAAAHDKHKRLTLAQRSDIVAQFARDMRALGPANFLFADGEAVYLHGDRRQMHAGRSAEGPGLHYHVQHSVAGRPLAGARGVKVKDGDRPVILAASVPLTDEEWTPLAKGELLVVQNGAIYQRLS
ncbi:MAG TPA: class II glutamine amidotransferase [Stellaceae bacterium]|nr:class II glutamine amidotransferase [Stellaceae bacterium]